MKGLITQTIDWLKHPIYAEANVGAWAGFLTLILVASFLWHGVLKHAE